MSSKSLSDKTRAKLEGLLLTLQTVATVNEAFRGGRSPHKLSNDWRYLQSYLAPDVLLHLHDQSDKSSELRNAPGIIIIPSANVAMAADANTVQSWLESNVHASNMKNGDIFKELETHLTKIKSRNGKAKARRLIDELKSMLG